MEDPTHGFGEFAQNASTAEEVRVVYAFRIFYHTGAGALYLLNQLDYGPLDEAFLLPDNTPYDLAKDFLDADPAILQEALEEAKASYKWEALVERSAFLLSLP